MCGCTTAFLTNQSSASTIAAPQTYPGARIVAVGIEGPERISMLASEE
jgi:hypothetical protein